MGDSEELKASAGTDGWDLPRKLVASLGPLPANFTTCIRTVKLAEMRMENKDSSALTTLAFRQVQPVVHLSPTLKSVFYFAAHQLRERDLDALPNLDELSLLKLFSADELLAALSLALITRKVRRICDEEQWKRLFGHLRVHMELGYSVGATVVHVGGANGMLVAALRYLSMAMLMVKDLEKFKAYRRETIKKEALFDLASERKLFGCDHLQIASLLLQNLGYGSLIGEGMFASSQVPAGRFGEWLREQDEVIQCWCAAILWTESLHATGKISDDLKGNDDLYLPDETIVDLQSLARVLRDKGSSWDWPLKGKKDLPEAIQEKLGVATGQSAGAPEHDSFDAEVGSAVSSPLAPAE
ncbi:MAG: hypothetical protein QY326_01480 [Bdellovibrionota bacterium]|nr:MAG: hypothetical protein QY326_01480 [Bdellovibrionota bacterium]